MRQQREGQAAILSVLFVMTALLAATFGTASIGIKETRVAEENARSKRAYFAAEAGIEDAVYRSRRNKNLAPSFVVTLNNATSVTTISTIGKIRTVTAEGAGMNAIRGIQAILKESTDDVQFFYGVQVGDGGLEMRNNSVVNGNIYSNGNIIGSNGALITGDAFVAGGINETPSIEWTAHNADQFFATTSSNRDIAQSFIAPASGALNRASVYIGKVGSPGSDIVVRITNDNGGKPSTSSIASAILSSLTIGSAPSWVNIAFSNPTMVSSGIKYWIVLDYSSNSATNYWNWRKDTTDAYANNTGRSTSNWSSGSASWINVGGDLAFRVWIGGTNTRIENMMVGDSSAGTGVAHANAFINVTIQGVACPNINCFIDNLPREEMPLSDGIIEDWRSNAEAGGVCVPPICDVLGNYTLNDASGVLGPIKIPGNLTVDNNATLTMMGTVWVAGDVTFSNNCSVFLDASYGSNSGVLLADGTITISNGCNFQGSGDPDSYIMTLSAKNSPNDVVLTVDNNAVGVIYYASNGRIKFSNNAEAQEATAYGIELDNNAIITYASGLTNVQFSSGPTGGWIIESWQEIVP